MRTRNLFRTGIFNLLFQLLFLALMFLFGYKTSINIGSPLRFIILTLLVLVLGIVWVFFFYFQDRREPEPIPYILGSFITGMALWALVGYPLIQMVFQTREWIHASVTLFITGSFFINGAVFALVMYLALRFIFVPLKEFDEPVDGMVYGAVIGAGYAVLMVIYELWNNPDYTLFIITYTVTVQLLVHSGVGSFMGYLTGRAKFNKTDPESEAVRAITMGIILLGIYHLFTEFIFVLGFNQAFWISFASTMIYTLLILAFCTLKMRRLTEKKAPGPKRLRYNSQLFLIIYVAGLLLTASLVSYYGGQGERYSDPEYGISFKYPHQLSAYSFAGVSNDVSISSNSLRMIFFRMSEKSPEFKFSIQVMKKTGQVDAKTVTSLVSLPNAENMLVENITIGEYTGKRVSYSYQQMCSAQINGFPKLHKVISDMIPVGNRLFIFTFTTTESDFQAGLKKYNTIIKSVSWDIKQTE